jgi:pimeloyl-ACP methyl ester carboxylesterase
MCFKIRRNCIFIFSLLSYLLCTVSSKSQVAQNPPYGKMINVGGHRIHIHVIGKGNPTVIFENGSGDFSFVWNLVQPEISKITRTVSYDRAGYAWSDPGPVPRTDRQITMELHAVLQLAGIDPPYILVGQSYGGFLVRAFTRYYPEEVKGMVLVEAVHENARIMINGKPVRIRELAKGLSAPDPILNYEDKSIPLPVDSVKIDSTIEPPLDRLSAQAQKWQIWAQSQPNFRKAVESEMSWSMHKTLSRISIREFRTKEQGYQEQLFGMSLPPK